MIKIWPLIFILLSAIWLITCVYWPKDHFVKNYIFAPSALICELPLLYHSIAQYIFHPDFPNFSEINKNMAWHLNPVKKSTLLLRLGCEKVWACGSKIYVEEVSWKTVVSDVGSFADPLCMFKWNVNIRAYSVEHMTCNRIKH